MRPQSRSYSRITGTGSYLPPRRLTNADLAIELAAKGVETSDDWIVERTGIRARHFAAPDVCASDLGFEAAKSALQSAGWAPQDIDLIIVATSTPDMVFPSTACILQHKLAQMNDAARGIAGCPAFDVQAVCSGFVSALAVADAMIQTGAAKRALVIGSEVFSRILDFTDRTTCVLLGDGAGAVVLEASDTPGILASDLHADGKHVGILCVPGNVSGGGIGGSSSTSPGVGERTFANTSAGSGGGGGSIGRLQVFTPSGHPPLLSPTQASPNPEVSTMSLLIE